MSFILDALRKSEHERQRSALPSLAHVPTASPQPRLPRWATLVMALLAATVLVLAGAWWQSERVPPPSATAPQAVVERPLTLPVPLSSAPATALPTATPRPLSERSALDTRSLADAAARPPDEPLAAAANTAATPAAAAALSPDAAVPSAAALVAQGVALPSLRLELHAYAEHPDARFVFINGRRYVEGERLTDGPDLVTIGPQGAVLSYGGQRFLLLPE